MTTSNDSPTAPARLIAHRGPGSMPYLDGPAVSTPWFDLGVQQAQTAIRLRGIATFNGDSGTGKTTTAVTVAAQSPIRFVYTKLKHGAGTRDVAEALYRALHPSGHLKPATKERVLVGDCTNTLMAGNIGVVADEVHRIGIPGMLLLSEIWDSVQQATGTGFPLFLVGVDVNAAINNAPELHTRICARANFHPLPDDALLAALNQMSNRFAATPDARLSKFDRLWCKGVLRYWRYFLNFLDNSDPDAEITVTEMRAYLAAQGQPLKDVKLT